jgi:hypothetical protein
MKQWMMFAGAAALAFAGPAMAKAGHGNGYGYGHGKGHGYGYGERGYGAGGCPPGLAKKGCMPPGQAKKLYRGERYPGYGTLYGYPRIPYSIRTRYALRPYDRYYYYDGNLYRVNPRTMLIEQVISALLR